MPSLGPSELDTLRRLLAEHAGLDIPDERARELAEVVRERLPFRGGDERLARYLAQLVAPADGGRELARLAQAFVVHETYFFRDRAQLEVIVDRAVADCARRPIRVLSAGSSTGAEAYSIAILLRERHPELAAAVEIVGIDLAPAAIEAARRGRYPAWALRETPPAIVQRYFRRRGGEYQIRDDVRAAASFEVRNIVGSGGGFWAPGAFDVVVFRNVLMYLAPAPARAALARIERALAAGGALFLGHAESLRGCDTGLELARDGDVFYYRKPDAIAAPAPPAAPAPAPSRREPPLPPPSLPAPASREPLIRRAVALVERGDLRHAEEACREALEADDLDPIPHYLQALCRDRAGDPAGAARHDIAAAYLDPTFALPCVHLALLAKRSGDRRAARRELSRALARLAREDEARLGLVGGGLDRAALIRFCRAELARGAAR